MLREIEARGSASVSELVAATALHENTVRWHLERLHGEGYLRCERTRPTGRGRPSLRWSAVRAELRDPYAGLVIALTETLPAARADAAALMRTAGVAWGARLAAAWAARAEGPEAGELGDGEPGGDPNSDPSGDAKRRVLEVMREQGFEPEDTGQETLLRGCPIVEAARDNTEVVCAAHHGMIEGLIGAPDQQLRVELLPFADDDDACVLRLRAAS